MSLPFLPSAPDLLLRGLAALGIILAGLLLYALLNRAVLARAQRASQPGAEMPYALNGTPTILYFTTPGCVPCKTVQRPALQRLQQQMGSRLQVVEINAAERPDLASRYGVLSVPTTFIIDARGQMRHVNHGVARAEKLMRQVETVL